MQSRLDNELLRIMGFVCLRMECRLFFTIQQGGHKCLIFNMLTHQILMCALIGIKHNSYIFLGDV